jgi:gliding motility-associated-like protein
MGWQPTLVKGFQIAAFCAALGLGWNVEAQVYQINGPDVTACSGLFVDDGDIGDPNGGPYTNADHVITICPDTPGSAIAAEFLAFQLQTNANPNNNDVLLIYDGNSTGAPLIGTGTGNNFLGVTATASINNPSGCLTFQFLCNNNATAGATGWAIELACVTPCTNPQSQLDLLDPEAFADNPNSVGVCPGQEVTFSGAGSTPDGEPLAGWLWNWGDGSIETTPVPQASHSYDTPGEYLVTLVVIDENNCNSSNLEPFQVLVSTIPIFNTIFSTPLCAGSPGYLDGNPVQSITWTALPPLAVSEEQNLPDNSNVPFTSDLVVTFFDEGQTVTSCDDLLGVSAVLEHTFIGDLTIWVECPNGQEMLLLDNGPSGGPDATGCMFPDLGGNDLGIPATGTGYTYTWNMDADYIIDDPNNPAVANGGTVPGGSYLPCGDFCDLLGCPLNGIWTLSIHDQWLGDDGYLFEWAIDFNPLIVPGVTTFTPTIGLEADSSYWDLTLNTPGVESVEPNGDYVELIIDTPGFYPFDYVVTNNFGCTWDTTVVVQVVPGLGNAVTAGPDVIFCQDPVQLQGAFSGDVVSACGNAGGSFEFCYGNNVYEEYTFCPDNPGDGTQMTISVDQGQVENAIFDQFYVYNGNSSASPILAGPVSGDLTGLSWTATNPSGCLTVSIDTDGSVSCASGSYVPIQFCVTCGGGSSCGYTWSWDPPLNLSDPNSPTPTVTAFDGIPVTYTLLVEPEDIPNCGTTDEVMVLPGFGFDYSIASQPTCFLNDGVISVNLTSPPSEGPWEILLTSGGTVVETLVSGGGLELLGGLSPGNYQLTLSTLDGSCNYTFSLVLNAPVPMSFNLTPSTTQCIDGMTSLQCSSAMDPNGTWVYTWNQGVGTGSQVVVDPVVTTTYTVFATDAIGCTSAPQTVTVTVFDSLSVQVTGDELICGGALASLEAIASSGGSGSGYTYSWTWSGIGVGQGLGLSYAPVATGEFCVTLSDNCETPPVSACQTVVIETPIPPVFAVDTTAACVPDVISFLPGVDPGLLQSWYWTFGDGEGSTEFAPFHTYEAPGVFDVTWNITSLLGCDYSATQSGLVTMYPRPSVGFVASPQPTTAPESTIEFEAVNALNVVTWYWVFDSVAGLGESNVPNPVFEFPIDQGGLYPVTLVVWDENNCSNQVTRIIEIFDMFNVYIPTAFSPNNDGVNDAFRVYGTDIDPDRFTFQIFNRWNEVIFETHDWDVPWHGPAVAGSEHYAQDGVYFYRVEVYSKSKSAERRELTGWVQLVR